MPTIWLTEGCNLNCSYCDLPHSGRGMSFDVWKQTVDYILTNYQAEYQSVSFFGGEPLLDKDQFVQFVQHGISRGIRRYSVTTNGTTFDSNLRDFFRANSIELLLSYDGDDQIKNRGSLADLSSNMNLLLDAYSMVLLTNANPLRFFSNVLSIWEFGFDHIFDNVLKGKYYFSEEVYQEFESQYEDAIDLMIESHKSPGPRIYLYSALSILQKLLNGGFRKVERCGWFDDSIGIDIDGRLYPCHRAMELGPGMSIGDVWNGLDQTAENRIRSLPKRPDGYISYCPIKYVQDNKCGLDCAQSESHYAKSVEVKIKVVKKNMSRMTLLIPQQPPADRYIQS